MSAPAAETTPPLRARLLGEVELRLGERVIRDQDWPRRSARSLLLLLLATPGHALPRDRVLDTLWPEAAPEAAKNALYMALHALRRVLEPKLNGGRASAYVEVTADTIRIARVPGCEVDLDAFEAGIRRADAAPAAEQRAALRTAIAAYGGELLPTEPYADWPVPRREALHQTWERAALTLAELDLAAGEPLASVPTLDALIAYDPTIEEAHRALIRAYLVAGQLRRARRQLDACARALREQLGEEPSPDTVALLVEAETVTAASSATTALRDRLTPPPAPATRLIGRDDLHARIAGLLASPGTRLVTLTGIGGIGKTHLALTIAADLVDAFVDGVAFVPLDGLGESRLVLPAIAAAVGIRDDEGSSPLVARLAAALRTRRMLLVLDNFEHVLDAAGVVADLLAAGPEISILVTSRERLRLRGEQEVDVPPLPTLDPERAPAFADVLQNPAVALLVDRLRIVQPAFAPAPANASVLLTICERLDGIPLALELAASWAKHLPLSELAARLTRPLDLLTDGPRDLPGRHRALRAAIASSCAMLTPAERTAFRRLAVFSGGIPTDAAVSVVDDGWPEQPADELAIRRLLTRVHDLGLVTRREAESDRYAMLATIKAFALGDLAVAGEHESTGRRHVRWYRRFAESAEPALETADQDGWLNRLDDELANLRAALAWSLERDPETALAIAGSLGRYWALRGLFGEGYDWLTRALTNGDGANQTARARALYRAGSLALVRGDLAGAGDWLAKAATLAEELADTRLAGRIDGVRGGLAHHHGYYDEAARHLTRGIERGLATGDDWGVAAAAIDAALVAYFAPDAEPVKERLVQAATHAERSGDRALLALCLVSKATFASWDGATDTAVVDLTRALELCRAGGDVDGALRAHLRLGEAYGIAGDLARAQGHFDRALPGLRAAGRLFFTATCCFYRAAFAPDPAHAETLRDLKECLEIWQPRGSGYTLDALQAAVRHLLARGDGRFATEVLAAIAARREADVQPLRVGYFRRDFDAKTACARELLGETAFAAAWQAGSARPIDEVVSAILALPEP